MLSFLLPLLKGACGRKSVLVEKDIPPDVDAGFLTVTDTNPLDKESYECAHLPSSTSGLV
jgi:hypothetical protein